MLLFRTDIVVPIKCWGQLQEAGNASTLSHYLQLLDSVGLLTGLEKAYKHVVRTKASSPKLQVLNTALISVSSNFSFQNVMRIPHEWGRHVESAVGAHLANSTRLSDINLFYWRDGNDEVDFILEKNGKYIGIEVKSGATIRAAGIRAFANKFQPHKLLLVGTGGIPWQQFLKINPEDLF